jgi:NAD dependent epimerase/dehydratase family enzyme
MRSSAKSEQCWAKSEQAERSAAEAKDPMAKKFFARIAQHWRDIAEDAERQSSIRIALAAVHVEMSPA